MTDATAAEVNETEKEPAPKAKPAKRAAKKLSPAKKGAGPRDLGIKRAIKLLLLKNPKLTAAEIAEKLKAADIPASHWTVEVIRAEFRHSLRVLADAGILKIEI